VTGGDKEGKMAEDRKARRARVKREIKIYRPLQTMFLWDVIKDRDSRPVLFWAAGTLLFGTLAYHWLEGWSYLDALYFCVISSATIGYGDLTPTTDVAKMFTILYVLNSVVILLALFDRIRVVRVQRIVQAEQDRSQS
jgi:hypothetical protein